MSHDHGEPIAYTTGTNTSGATAIPSEPAVMCSDIAKPLRWSDAACTSAAAGG